MGYYNNYYLRIKRKNGKGELMIGCEDGKLYCFDDICRKDSILSGNCIHVKEAYQIKEILQYFKKKGYPVTSNYED